MNNIVTRLRDSAHETDLCREAANEIEMLRRLLGQQVQAFNVAVEKHDQQITEILYDADDYE
jgi:hypothetical protein